MKKYCLLENGDIRDCYFNQDQNEPRNIYKDGKHFYLDLDVVVNSCIFNIRHRILKFGDTIEELKEWWKNESKRIIKSLI